MSKTTVMTEIHGHTPSQDDLGTQPPASRSSSAYVLPQDDSSDLGLTRTTSVRPSTDLRRTLSHGSHMGEPLENLARALSNRSPAPPTNDDNMELRPIKEHRVERFPSPRPVKTHAPHSAGLPEEAGSPTHPLTQGIPPELGSLTRELVFVAVCSSGQLLFSFFLGSVTVNQQQLRIALDIGSAKTPWLVGSYLIALGLSVIVSGSLTDLVPPKLVVVGAFAWLTLWNLIGVFTLTPARSVLFFFTRAMQGLAVGVLVSASMSILGRVYKPGQRKTQVFSAMAAASPFGFWLGALEGGAFTYHLEWIFGLNTIICGLLCAAAFFSIPALRPAADVSGAAAPSLRQFDVKGALCAVVGCVCLLFGLTQGSAAQWAPYTYVMIILGVLILALFFWVENQVARPLIPSKLWRTPGFAPLMAAYFLSFGAFVGAWQWYVVQFFLRVQHKAPITVALYLLPNAIMGVLATWIVSRMLHLVPGHYIYLISMFAYALGPAFFLGQRANQNYWELSMPGIALATFGPDLSFAAASVYITSNVQRSYQGSAGSLLVTIQNLSSAIMTSLADAVASKVDLQPDGEIGLRGLKAAWWLALAAQLLGALITAVAVRIPKEEEKEHVT